MRTLHLPFLALVFSLPIAAQEDPLERDSLEFVAYVGEAEIAREHVTLTEEGWSAKGSFDVLGTRAGEYSAVVEHLDTGGIEFALTITEAGNVREIDGVFDGSEVTVTASDKTEPKTAEVKGDHPFVYEDLLWAAFIDLGRMLVELDDAGELDAEQGFTALLGSAGISFPVTFKSVEPSPQLVLAQQVLLRIYTVNFAGAVEIEIVCSPSGLPVRIDIPSQLVSVQVVGLEGVRGSRGEPTSIVDAGAWRDKLSKPEHEFEVKKGVAVPMRDGIELIADVYTPKGDGPFPTILARTPYSRATEGGLKGAYYAKRGYAFVGQDVRGRFDSGGEWFPFVNETRDGSDTIDWIAAQPWSNGKVGMVGASYVGLVQWLAAKSANPHLVCIVPQVSPPDPQENFPYEGGAMILGAIWWARVLESMDTGEDWSAGIDWPKVYSTLPLGDMDEALGLKEQTFLDVWMAHPPHDLEFWEPSSYQAAFPKMKVPAMHITGWWDGDQPGALQNFAGMRRSAPPEVRDHQYLIVGPWTHFFNTQRKLGEVDFGDEAVVDLDSRIVRFFDHYMKGVDNGIEGEPRVLTFTMGANEWHGEEEWPLPQTEFTELYLSSGGNANKLEGDGRLGLSPPKDGAPSDTYRYDPFDVPELDVDFTDLSGAEATADQSDEPDREDDLEFMSPPLATACELVGPIEVVLWTRTDAEDTDYGAVILRVNEKGEQFILRGGFQRLRYAADPLRDQPVPPGTVARVTIDCWATGTRLEKGDRLLVRLTSWGWPGIARNLNTLEPFATAKEGVVATNTILHDAKHPSHLRLPVVPRDGAPGLSFATETDAATEEPTSGPGDR